MLALANQLQRAQICVQRSRAWMLAQPTATEDAPEVIALLSRTVGAGTASAAPSAPVPSFANTSAGDLQSMLQARLQASRKV